VTLNQALRQATISVPDAGRIFFDLARNASYDAAKSGDIPTIKVGGLLRVPVAKLCEMLGIDRETLEHTPQKKGPAEVAPSPSHGSQSLSGRSNMTMDTTACLRMAMASCDEVGRMIHAAWMAAGSLDGDNRAEGEAIKSVVHMAGEFLEDVRLQLRKAGAV
jgi:hypothetical protein